jgi:hypothetical protein
VNRAVRNEWVRRLRSGDYAQGTGQLYRAPSNEYCCLGVLCEVAVEVGLIDKSVDGYGFRNPGEHPFWFNGVLPSAVIKWAELPDANPSIREVPLSNYNDGRDLVPRHSFTEIARLIEENL